MDARTIINKIQGEDYNFACDSLVLTTYSIAGLDEDDYYEVIDYLDAHNIKYTKDRRSMTGIWLIELY